MRAVRLLPALTAAALAAIAPAPAAQERLDADVLWKIRREATERSEIMATLHVLTDLYGPRLTGSPNLRRASEWVVRRTTEWGLVNAHLDPWDFGHPGWLNERASVHVVAPVQDALVVEVLAWTPGTNGPVRGRALLVTPPDRPTQEELDAFFDAVRTTVKGRVVLVGAPAAVPFRLVPPPKRREDEDVRAQFDPARPPIGGPPVPAPPPAHPGALSPQAVDTAIHQFLARAGALARVNDAGREHGQIRAFHNRTFDVSQAVPTVVMRNEDYGRLARLMASGHEVEIELDIVNRTFEDGRTQYNVIAEIPGTDKAHEVVMLGGHLDSWHAATGATDNAIGCAVMLEVVRILKALGVTPRRTIRLALWSGEEQGLLGSQAYVKKHFGTFEDPKPAYEHFAGYFNIDSGTGRARGMTVFGPEEAARILHEILAPFADVGVAGATATTSRRRGGSDHTSFNEAGLPGIGVAQDPIEYGTHSWHTNLDTYERILESDAQQAAMVIAAAVYQLAMREDKLPRFPPAAMPKPPTP